MKEIFVYNRAEIESLPAHDVPHVIVSISTPGDPNGSADPKTNEHTVSIMWMSFYDMDRVIEGYNEEYTACMFKRSHAQSILKFVNACPDVNRILVHCDAGLSRSPGVAAALAKIFNDDDSQWFKTKSGLNRLVYRTILEEHHNPEHQDGNDSD